jgi:branched-chain amino acid transport system substrate-binding protein
MNIVKTVATIAVTLFGFSTVNAEEIKIGVQLPLTGAYARSGKALLEGITTATEVFNRHNPKHKVKLIVIDDETVVTKAISAVEKLASQGVMGIAGGFTTRLIAPAAGVANKEGLAYITVGATGREILDQGFKTFFRLNNNEGYTDPIFGLITDLGIKKVSMLTLNTQGNIEAGADVKRQLTGKGVKVVEHKFDPGIADFKPLLNKVKVQDQPEVLLLNCLESDNIGILRAAKVLKPNVKGVIGMYSIATAKIATEFPDLVQNVLGTALLPFPSEFRTAEGKEFEQTFRKLYSREPDYLNQLGYVKGQVMCEAMKRAAEKKNLTRAAVVSEMHRTNRDTLIGRVSFNDKGDNPNFRAWISQHQQGKKIPLVWPKEVANGRMNYPAVPW